MTNIATLLNQIPTTDNLTLVHAPSMMAQYHPTFPPHMPVLIHGIASAEQLAKVHVLLLLVYPPSHPIQVNDMAALLADLAPSQLKNYPTSLYIPPLGANTSLEEFQELIAHLRAPDGCPWDREQTHQSLRRNLIEETYEVVDALDAADPAAMQEEFGDLMVQVALHAQIASEAGEFRMADVLNGIITKLIARHPHVFGEVELGDADAVIANWENLKAAERKQKGTEKGLLDGVSAALPALSQAEAYTSRAARVGFEWPNIEGVLGDVAEEIQEFRAEAAGTPEQEAEFGDILFALVNLSRWLKIDAEAALRAANARFRKRFAFVEAGARAQGRPLSELTLDEMNVLWEQSKRGQ
ncbi:MAG TPA: nucleoside triphosphate pyrophosphohydrolase [Anaerolineales bacterium]|nr:nucleoside triphosphate pyrophosphohydrolase [Anaerolineales bacterium]HRQ92798.1 nucleoside triphosphate pyrophosphohydrolase [Anaerolineales bacterium]